MFTSWCFFISGSRFWAQVVNLISLVSGRLDFLSEHCLFILLMAEFPVPTPSQSPKFDAICDAPLFEADVRNIWSFDGLL